MKSVENLITLSSFKEELEEASSVRPPNIQMKCSGMQYHLPHILQKTTAVGGLPPSLYVG